MGIMKRIAETKGKSFVSDSAKLPAAPSSKKAQHKSKGICFMRTLDLFGEVTAFK